MKTATVKPVSNSAGRKLARPLVSELAFPANKKRVPKPAGHSSGAGAVHYCVHGRPGKPKGAVFTPSRVVAALRAGLPYQELEELRAHLDMSMDQLLSRLDISKATLHRRKAGGKLEPAESDRVLRFARLLGRALVVLESAENARGWLSAPQFGLGGAVPFDYAETEAGAREVEDLLGRIEYGVYS